MSRYEASVTPAGEAISILSRHRSIKYEEHKIDETRFRRLAWYSAQWLNLKGKTPEDLYPIVGEGKDLLKTDESTGLLAAYELQKRLDAGKAGKGVKQEKKGEGFKTLFG